MKKLLFIGFALFIALTLVLGLSSCGDSSAVQDKATLTTETLSLNGENISGKVPYSTESFNFSNDIKVTNDSPWVVSTDPFGMQIAASKTVPLAEGNNTVYIHVTNPDQTVSTYTVNIYRNQLYKVSFNVKGGTSVEAQYVEEGYLAEEPTTSRVGYTFDSWDYSFDTPITSNITVNARFKVAEEMANFEFTSTATTCTITGIKDKSVTEIIVPDYVTAIDSGMFPSVGAFSGCYSLTSVVIGDSVTTIGDYTFSACYKLVEVINKSSLNITAGSEENGYVAYYAKEVHSGDSKIVNQNDYLFYTYNGVNYLLGYVGTDTELTLPENYNGEKYEIYKCAFYNCDSLTSVEIPDSVTTIGSSAFSNCYKLVEVINKSSLNITAGSEDNGRVAYYANEVHSGDSKIVNQNGYLFYTYNGVNYLLGYVGTDTELALPESYNGEKYKIYNYAFYNCDNLTSVVIGDSVTTIGFYAFNDCTSLTSVEIGDSVTTIVDWAFSDCYKLVEVINKSSLNITAGSYSNGYVAYYAKEVHSGESKIVNQNDYLFYTYNGVNYLVGYVGTDTKLTLPESYNGEKYEIYNYAFAYCRSLTSIVIGDSVTTIGKRAFYNCYSLTSVVIGDSITTIGDYAFFSCDSLNYKEYDNAYYLGNENNPYLVLVEAKNTSITNVTIHENTRVVSAYAFAYCDSLTNVEIPDSVTTIGDYAFAYCDSLTSVEIPDSVTIIGERAFYSCDSLTSIKYRGTEAQWSKISKGTNWNLNTGSYTITYNYSGN